MARTLINSGNVAAQGIVRADLNIATAASAVIAKVIASTGITLSYTGVDSGTGDVTLSNTFTNVSLNVFVDGGGAVPATGIKAWVRMPFAGTIINHDFTADASGSAILDIWKTTYTTIPATSATKITSSTPPTLSSAIKAQDSTLTSWTTTFSAGDYFYFSLTSVTTCKQLLLALQITRS